jgi:hypothetical protein
MRISREDLRRLKEQRFGGEPQRRGKYRAKKTEYNGVLFDSKKEAAYCARLDLMKAAGKISYYLRQVPFDLPGGVKYRVDFMEVWSDGRVRYVDVKGVRTQVYIMKKKQVEALYPVVIEEE